MSTVQNLLHDNVRLLEQGLALLAGLDEETYRSPRPDAGLSGAGSHVRHCIDFYDRFLESLAEDATGEETGEETGPRARLDYDRRQRDERLERCPRTARAKIRGVIEALRERVPARAGRALVVKADAEGVTADDAPWADSSVERELQVLLSHTVHHYALIAVALRLHGHPVDEEFGVAPSTLRYWATLERRREPRACAR